MKYVWEPQDIIEGRKVQAGNRSETWMLGYHASGKGPNKLTIISLSDGMVVNTGMTRVQLVAHLNASGMRPVDIHPNDHKVTPLEEDDHE